MKVFLALMVLMTTAALAQDWRTVNPSMGEIPAGALKSGNESDGKSIYVMRVNYEGGLCVGKYVPENKAAYVSYGGKEIGISNPVEVFCGSGTWTAVGADGQIPVNATNCGSEADGSPLYAISAVFMGGVQIGKYSVKNKSGYIPYGGKEYEMQDNFSVLVHSAAKQYAVDIDYDAMNAAMTLTGTNDKINVSVHDQGNAWPFSQTFDAKAFSTPKKPFNLTFTSAFPVVEILISTDGGDAFRIECVTLYEVKDGKRIQLDKWGSKGNPKGFCLSTDPKDTNAGWKGNLSESGCQSCLTFEVAGHKVYPCRMQ